MTSIISFPSRTINLNDFDVDPLFGFVPQSCAFLSSLNPYYEPWNVLVIRMPDLLAASTFRKEAASLPLLDSDRLQSVEEWRCAYLYLACFVQAYVFEDPHKPCGLVPVAISQPFIRVCIHWGMQPVLGHIGYCLWNWRLKDGSDAQQRLCDRQDLNETIRQKALQDLDELEMCSSFTGTHDEKIFCMVAMLVEINGGPLVYLLLNALLAAEAGAVDLVITQLKKAKPHLEDMSRALQKMNDQCTPAVFYNQIRPFIAGSKGMESRGLPDGIIFELADGQKIPSKCIGATAAQSSLFQFIDHVFGIEHNSHTLEDMRLYMPRKHREFLDLVKSLPPLREFAKADADNEELRQWFDDCIMELRRYRTRHISIATRYVVVPARAQARSEGVKGTGGSLPLPFLKKVRDETV